MLSTSNLTLTKYTTSIWFVRGSIGYQIAWESNTQLHLSLFLCLLQFIYSPNKRPIVQNQGEFKSLQGTFQSHSRVEYGLCLCGLDAVAASLCLPLFIVTVCSFFTLCLSATVHCSIYYIFWRQFPPALWLQFVLAVRLVSLLFLSRALCLCTSLAFGVMTINAKYTSRFPYFFLSKTQFADSM